MSHTGVMIGYFLPSETAEFLRVNAPDGVRALQDLHVTVLFLGDIELEQVESIRFALRSVSARQRVLAGNVGGLGRFPASVSSEGRDVLVSLVDVPRLEAFREDLIASLRQVDVEPVLNHGYTPHVTLAYVSPEFEVVSGHPQTTVVAIDNVSLALGATREEFPFTTVSAKKKAEIEFFMNPFAGPANVEDFTVRGEVAKIDEAQHLVFGWANIIEAGGEVVTDLQGDRISAAVMERTAYDYVLESRIGGEMHLRSGSRPKKVARLVESIAFTEEKQKVLNIELGIVGWWIGFKVDDEEVWLRIMDKTYKGFSIHGFGRRVDAAA